MTARCTNTERSVQSQPYTNTGVVCPFMFYDTAKMEHRIT